MRQLLQAALCLAFLSACAVNSPDATSSPLANGLPQGQSFGQVSPPQSQVSNAVLARDFDRLVFQLESGRSLPVLARFEGPITVALTGLPPKAVTSQDLDRLLARLRREARIDITRVNAPADITIELVPNRALRRAVPNAACFVVPNVSSWRDFMRVRGTAALDWTQLRTRSQMGIFIPAEISPQETRDCLHEELAQSLGPVNDLYDLNDSVFNDDNFQTILTGFDMAILRAFYADELRSGLSRAQVMARLPAILARQRPRHGPVMPLAHPRTDKSWKNAIAGALGADANPGNRVGSARRAVLLARQNGWNDNRLGFSLYALARLTIASDPPTALESFRQADEIFRAIPETRLHAAHIASQMAAAALSSGRVEQAIAIVEENAPVALAGQNAALLSALLMIKATGLEQLGRDQEARIVELDSLAWARYAYASENEIRARAREIRNLAGGLQGDG